MNKLNVLYEDNHIIVVEKPINILSQKDNTNDLDLFSMVKDYIKVKYNKPGNVYLALIHRLDRPVGGIMVFARTSKAAKRLNEDFKKHLITKKYLAICYNEFEKTEGTYKDRILKIDNGSSIISDKGKEAILDYKVLKYNKEKNITLVEITLKTGRHHQIRVQFSHHGHTLCGDQRYGIQDKKQICLYAYKLKIFHPITKEKMEFTLKPPKISFWTEFTL